MAKTATRQKSAEDWVRAATRALAAHGVDAVRVERLATDLGVTKGSFYWHFADLAALRAAILNTWEARATTEIIERIEAGGGTAADKLRRLGEIVFAGEGRLERQMRAWGAQDAAAAAVQERVDARRVTYVQALFVKAGLPQEIARPRALFLYQALVGFFTIGRRRGIAGDELRAIADLLLTPPQGGRSRPRR